MSLEEEVRQLRTANAALRAENTALRAQVAALTEQVSRASERLREREQGTQRRGTVGKAASKPPVAPRGQRRARAPETNAGRRRMEPTD